MQSLISELVGEAYPPAVAIEGGRLRRNWLARMASVLPSEATLDELGRVLETEALESIKQACAFTATADVLVAMRPSIRLLRLDDVHLIVRIEFAGPETSVGNAAAISQWGVLQSLDRRLRLDELQGLPCVYWFFIRAVREAGP